MASHGSSFQKVFMGAAGSSGAAADSALLVLGGTSSPRIKAYVHDKAGGFTAASTTGGNTSTINAFIQGMAFSSDDAFLSIVKDTNDDGMRLLNISSTGVMTLADDQNGRLNNQGEVATSNLNNNLAAFSISESVHLYGNNSGTNVRHTTDNTGYNLGSGNGGKSVDFSKNDQYLVVPRVDNKITIFTIPNTTNATTGNQDSLDNSDLFTSSSITDGSGVVACARFIDASHNIAAVTRDSNNYQIITFSWDGSSLTQLDELTLANTGDLSTNEPLAVSPDGKYAFVGVGTDNGQGANVFLVDLNDLTDISIADSLEKATASNRRIHGNVKFSASGTFIASTVMNTDDVHIFSHDGSGNLTHVREFDSGVGNVYALAFSNIAV